MRQEIYLCSFFQTLICNLRILRFGMNGNVSRKDVSESSVGRTHQLLEGSGHYKSGILVRGGLEVEPHVIDGRRPIAFVGQDQTKGSRFTNSDGFVAARGVHTSRPLVGGIWIRRWWCPGRRGQGCILGSHGKCQEGRPQQQQKHCCC